MPEVTKSQYLIRRALEGPTQKKEQNKNRAWGQERHRQESVEVRERRWGARFVEGRCLLVIQLTVKEGGFRQISLGSQ